MMSLWREDLSTYTLDEVLQSQAENRVWSKELRRRTSSLVNNRLANEISQADYQVSRKLAVQDALECQRRAAILDAHIRRAAS